LYHLVNVSWWAVEWDAAIGYFPSSWGILDFVHIYSNGFIFYSIRLHFESVYSREDSRIYSGLSGYAVSA
jgi:hypothetical protein